MLDEFERVKAKAKDAVLRSWPDARKLIEFNLRPFLKALTSADLRTVLDAALGRKAPISGKRAVRYLGRVYRWKVKRGEIAANPTAGLDLDELARPERPRRRALSDRSATCGGQQ